MHKTIGIILLLTTICAKAEDKWMVHEWGTFTSLQNERGEAIGGINTDDEPVPQFVHRLATFLLLQPTEIPRTFCQGAPAAHPDVTMRLETPVVYFHPPHGQKEIATANFAVKFRGGWLTEYYPQAESVAPGLRPENYDASSARFRTSPFGPLASTTESRLEWTGLKIGGQWEVTNTTEHVWTSPRAVKCAQIQAANGESEKFLFYRGVAHINAPIRISRNSNAGELLIRSQLEQMPFEKPLPIRYAWLVDIQSGGKVAFRQLPPFALEADSNKIIARTATEFTRRDFSTPNLKNLRNALHSALVAEGLFADEADALLNTWELSYFKSAGLRVFFLVPHEWTDFYLPIATSLPADTTRVMVGRIELVTPKQRDLLREIARSSTNAITAQATKLQADFYARATGQPRDWNKSWAELWSGSKRLSDYVSIPETYENYLELGRFRNALVLDHAKRFPSEGLTSLISMYGLQAYQVPRD